MRPTRAQISLSMRAVWSAPCYSHAGLSRTWSKPSEDRFYHAVAHMTLGTRGSFRQRALGPNREAANAHLNLCRFINTNKVPFPMTWPKWATSQENLSSGFVTRLDSNRPAQLERLARSWNFGYSKRRYYNIQAANNKGADLRILICAFVVLIWHEQVFSWWGSNKTMQRAMTKPSKWLWAQQGLRSARVISLCYALYV